MSFPTSWASERLAVFEPALAGAFADAFPPALQSACRYPLTTGGKRMRPLLVFAAAESVGGSSTAALPAALAVELLHTYSLVHDDLPCMDDDDERRGRPTVHKVYGEAVAVLVGDALQTEAFAMLAPNSTLCAELARASGAAGMVAGQFLDIAGGITTMEALIDLHAAKTGALIRAAVRMGGLSAGARGSALAALTAYGEAVGLAFQVHDDVLDADADADDAGPPSFVKLLGLAGATAAAAAYAGTAIAAAETLPSPAALIALARFSVERAV